MGWQDLHLIHPTKFLENESENDGSEKKKVVMVIDKLSKHDGQQTSLSLLPR